MKGKHKCHQFNENLCTRQTGFQPHVYFICDKIVDICSNILESKIKGLLNRKKSSWNKNLASSI